LYLTNAEQKIGKRQDVTPFFVVSAYEEGLQGGDDLHIVTAGVKAYAVSSALQSFSSYLGNGYTSQVIRGGVNGYLQTGDRQGFYRGLASGAIPNDLGLSYLGNYSYTTNPYANIGIDILRGGVKGYIVSGNRRGAERGAALEFGPSAIGHLIGFITTGSAPSFSNGTFIYSGEFWSAKGALTVVNVISGYRNDLYTGKGLPTDLLKHELDHINNPFEQGLGASYPVVHIIELFTGHTVCAMGFGFSGFFIEDGIQEYPYSKTFSGRIRSYFNGRDCSQ
jgi:hypothetical protein